MQASAEFLNIVHVLNHHLTARKCHTTAGLLIEELVPRSLFHQLVYAVLLPAELTCGAETDILTVSADITVRTIEAQFVSRTVRHIAVFRTGSNTASAKRALFTAKHQLFFIKLTLRIMAPKATQRTTLEKDRCPYTVTVAHGEFLNVKDNWIGQALTPPSLTAVMLFLAFADFRSYSNEQGVLSAPIRTYFFDYFRRVAHAIEQRLILKASLQLHPSRNRTVPVFAFTLPYDA